MAVGVPRGPAMLARAARPTMKHYYSIAEQNMSCETYDSC